MTLLPVCEYVEPSESRLRIAIRLRHGEASSDQPYRLTASSRSGRTVTAESRPEPRVSVAGNWTMTQLVFDLDPARLPPGSYRLRLTGPGLRSRTDLSPAAGLLASSRPRRLGDHRVQVFPAAGSEAVWLRVARRSRAARVGWSVRNVLRDVGFVLHGRRFSWIRPVRWLSSPFVPRGPIWLVGERSETARDNGRVFFEHARKTRPDAAIYYVLDRDSPMRAPMAAAYGNVVDHSSWRHRLLMLHADVLINAYSIKHMLPRRWHPGAYMLQAAWRTGARRVYLKHGVQAMPYAIKRANGGYDLVVTVGPRETASIAKVSGYDSQLAETGLARFDDLRGGDRTNTILFMPTWRRSLVPRLFSGSTEPAAPFEGSEYVSFVDDLLGAGRLASILERHELRMLFVPHYNLARLFASDRYRSERIEVLDGTTADIPRLLRRCDLLLTDYSSVHFDVAYVGAPVVYAQFDMAEFEAGQNAGSWFDFAGDGFGPVVTTVDQVIDALERYAEAGFRREPEYEARVGDIFAHRDHGNSSRILAAIDAMEASREP